MREGHRSSQVRLAVPGLALAAALLLPVSTRAQGPGPALPRVSVGSDHWVYPLLDRMARAGLADGVWLPGRRPGTVTGIAAALDTAATRAAGTAWQAVAARAAAWFRAEYGLEGARRGRIAPLLGLRAADGPRVAPDGILAGAQVLYRPAGDVGLRVEPVLEVGAAGLELPTPRLDLAWEPGPVRLAASYDALRYEPGASGGIVMGGMAKLGRVEAALVRPVRLPWLLRYLGPAQGSFSVSRIAGDSLGPPVAFLAGELRLQPHPRVTIGLYRSWIVAWTVDGAHPGALDVARMAIGRHTPYDDQRAAVSVLIRADVLGTTLAPYLDWGLEDTAGLDEDPGVVLGVWLPAVPVAGTPIGARYEYAAFGRDAQLRPGARWETRNWYRHGSLRREYVDGSGELLGHPLGGYGHEHRLELETSFAAGLMTTLGGYIRVREDAPGAHNLLADVQPGRSQGGYGRLTAMIGALRLEAGLDVEVGDGWSRTQGRLVARMLLD